MGYHYSDETYGMKATKVGVREFRSGLAEYIASATPVAVTRHGQTVGYFIPTRGGAEVDIETVATEFKGARKAGKVPVRKLSSAARR